MTTRDRRRETLKPKGREHLGLKLFYSLEEEQSVLLAGSNRLPPLPRHRQQLFPTTAGWHFSANSFEAKVAPPTTNFSCRLGKPTEA